MTVYINDHGDFADDWVHPIEMKVEPVRHAGSNGKPTAEEERSAAETAVRKMLRSGMSPTEIAEDAAVSSEAVLRIAHGDGVRKKTARAMLDYARSRGWCE